MNIDSVKICKKCLIEKEKSCFPIRSDNKKHRNECNECLSKFKRHFKNLHKDKYKQKAKQWSQENKEHVLAKSKKYNSQNRESILEKKKLYYKKNEERTFATKLKKFGLSVDQYNQMLKDQNYCCAICNKPETSLNNKKTKICRLAVDHCHKTGKVRSLLCANCNRALGLLKEDVSTVQSVLIYLRLHNDGE